MVNTPSSQPKPEPFPIPGVAIASHPSVILKVRDLRRWIDDLPLGNPPKAGQMLLQQLRLLVRDPQPGARFESLLELYNTPLRQLLPIVQERLPANPDSALPLDQLDDLLIELLTELAYGHLRIANESLVTGKAPSAETLFRAMRLLNDALNIQRLHYRRLETRLWQLLLSIFQQAEQLQVDRQRIEYTAQKQTDDPDSIHGLFFSALIISLCDPHHRRPSELLDWSRWTAGHTALLGLTILPQGAFAIPVDVSGTLSPLAGARIGRPGPETHYLATDRFLQQLQDDPTAVPGLHRALTDLIKGRKTPEQRQTPRQPCNHPYRLVHGLRNIHQRLTELTQGETASREAVPSVACRQINQSKFGAAFHLQGPLNPPLTVGEPILAEMDTASGPGTPVGFSASIRRLVSDEHQQIEIGVEKLQGRLVPLTIVGAAAERTRGDNHALLLATEAGKYTLLAAHSIYREGDVVATEGPSMRYKLRMLRLTATVQHTVSIEVDTTDG